jgi:sulfonate transport system permease protein
MRTIYKKVLLGSLVPVLIVIAWVNFSHRGWIPAQILPDPGLVYKTFAAYTQDGTLVDDTLIRLKRVMEGFIIGATFGTAFGAVMGLSSITRSYVEPLFVALTQVPVFGWAPLVIVLLGIDEGFKVSLIAWAAFIPAVLNTMQGVRGVPSAYKELGQVYRLGRWPTLRMIVMPAALPAVFVGLREALANSWQTLVAAELLASSEGLGYLMSWGRQLFQLEVVMTAMIVVGVIGMSFNLLFQVVEKRLQPWKVVPS